MTKSKRLSIEIVSGKYYAGKIRQFAYDPWVVIANRLVLTVIVGVSLNFRQFNVTRGANVVFIYPWS